MTTNYHRTTHRPRIAGGTDPIDYVVLKIKFTGDRAEDEVVAPNTRAFMFADRQRHARAEAEAGARLGLDRLVVRAG